MSQHSVVRKVDRILQLQLLLLTMIVNSNLLSVMLTFVPSKSEITHLLQEKIYILTRNIFGKLCAKPLTL